MFILGFLVTFLGASALSIGLLDYDFYGSDETTLPRLVISPFMIIGGLVLTFIYDATLLWFYFSVLVATIIVIGRLMLTR